jgi:hypothetical protein
MVLLPTVFVITAVGFAVPGENVPVVNVLSDGSTEYVFQSLREAVLVPAGAASFAVFLVLSAFLFRPRPRVERAEPTEPAEVSPPRPESLGRGAVWLVGSGLLLAVALCLLAVTVLWPLNRFRRAVISHERVELHALLRSWSLRRSSLRSAKCLQERRDRGRAWGYHLVVELVDEAGGTHRSVARYLSSDSPEFLRYRDAMRRFAEQLGEEAPGGGESQLRPPLTLRGPRGGGA